jgi:hypothetical protein
VLWLSADVAWRERAKTLIVPSVVTLLSFAAYGFWPLDILETMRLTTPGVSPRGYTNVMPYWGLVLLLPALLPMDKWHRFYLVMCALLLGLPHIITYDMALLVSLHPGLVAVSWAELFMFERHYGWLMAAIPAGVYGWIMWQWFNTTGRQYLTSAIIKGHTTASLYEMENADQL